jgi:signal transduction histidine kinase
MKRSNLKTTLTTILLLASGLPVFFIARWNAIQADILLQWAADREGKAIFARIMHESGISPGMVYRNPELLKEQIAQDTSIAAAGVMLGETVIASYSKQELSKTNFSAPQPGAKIIDSNFSAYRKFSGPGAGNGRRGAGHGPPWMRDSSNEPGQSEPEKRISFYFIFQGPDRAIVAPLTYQKYLWPIAWLLLSVLWAGIMLYQNKMTLMEKSLQKESHLASIGKMSARLAHEIKNPLGAIRGIAQLLEKKLNDQAALKSLPQTIEKETFRLEELTKNILDFARPADLKPVRININAAIADTMSFFRLHQPQHKIEFSLPDQNVFVLCDDNATRQIIINLLKNAVDATKEADTIKLEVKFDNERVKIQIFNPGQLSPEIEENKFEPFYSTKVKGYGLGLSISKKLAEQQNGSLKLENHGKNLVMAELSLPRDAENE